MPFTSVIPGVFQCNDCGAHADTIENIPHHDTCSPNESAKWERTYAAANEEGAELHCAKCTGVKEIGLDACSGCCGR